MRRSLISIKKSLADLLQNQIENQEPLAFSWRCYFCHSQHTRNILKRVRKVVVLHQIEQHKPDLTLFDDNENVFGVVQFSTKKKEDVNALSFYQAKNIIYIQVKLDAQDDFESLKAKITAPIFVSICLNPRCKECNHYLGKTVMTIVEADCYKCKELMKVAVIEAGMSRDSTCVGPERFTSEEIELAREKGVIIEQHFSNTMQKSYIANTCLSCKAFIGQHYLFTDYLSLAGWGTSKMKPMT